MGSKGNSRHIKRLAAPRYLHVGKKVSAYVTKPNAGRHTLESSIALATVLKEKLGLAKNTKEAKRIVKSGNVEINGKAVKDERFPLGFGDVIHFKPGNESYEVSAGRKGTVSIKKHEGKKGEQVFKVTGKYIAKGKTEMIRLYNGSVMPSAKGVSVNDSVIVKGGKVESVIKLEKGARCFVIKGVHASESGTISGIKPGTALRSATVEIDGEKGKTETSLENVMVIGAK